MVGLLRRLWEMPPREVAHKLSKRIRGSSTYDLDDLLRSAKHMRAQLFYDFLSRYEAILARAHGWQPLEFEDRAVLEVGCGPVLGFGPLALFLGCRSYTAIEPTFDAELALHPRVQDGYYLRVYKDLAGVFGPRMSYEAFLHRLRTRATVARTMIEHADFESGTFDIVLSNSTLEHLQPLEASIRKLRLLSKESARFVHLVDFGNHRPTRSPFSGMYSVEPDVYLGRYGKGINLARAPDMLRVFREAGFNVGLQPYYWYREFFDESIAPWWKERYTNDDLFLKAAIVFGPTPGLPSAKQ